MKKLLGIVVLGFLLSSCGSPSYNYEKPSTFGKTQTRKTECVTHSGTGLSYCYTHGHRNSALQAAISKCKLANPNNKSGCNPNNKVSKTNTTVSTLEDLIKDFESGKISKKEFDKKKKELIGN